MKIGVCGRNEADWPDVDYQEIKRGKFGVIKLMSQTNEAVFKRVREAMPDGLIITRLYHPSFNKDGHLSPHEFVGAMIPAIRKLSPYCAHYQIHNEPNHRDGIEGWGSTDADAQGFNTWFLAVYRQLKKEFPDLQFGFPGLALPDFAHRDRAWLQHCAQAINEADWLGCHCYWQSPPDGESVMFHPNFGLNYEAYHAMFPEKDIHILEAGNSNCQNNYPLSDEQQSNEYVAWIQRVRKSTYVKSVSFFILSSPDESWRGFSLVGKTVVDSLAGLSKPKTKESHQDKPKKQVKAKLPSFTNQQVINGFWRAENLLGITPPFTLMSKAGLDVNVLAQDRDGPYKGPSIAEVMPNLLPAEQNALSRELGVEVPPVRDDNYETELAAQYGVEVGVVRAVLQVESGGKGIRNGRMTIRFEPHIFYDYWGQHQPGAYWRHFQIGKPRWAGQQHRYRPDVTGEWLSWHGSQDGEWQAYHLARSLDTTAATLSISMGAGQVMGFNHRACGYDSAVDMFDDFSESEENQLRGMFRFIASKEARLTAMRNKDWYTFAKYYNGAGQANYYAGLLQRAYANQ